MALICRQVAVLERGLNTAGGATTLIRDSGWPRWLSPDTSPPWHRHCGAIGPQLETAQSGCATARSTMLTMGAVDALSVIPGEPPHRQADIRSARANFSSLVRALIADVGSLPIPANTLRDEDFVQAHRGPSTPTPTAASASSRTQPEPASPVT
jgi:hypothetical protein